MTTALAEAIARFKASKAFRRGVLKYIFAPCLIRLYTPINSGIFAFGNFALTTNSAEPINPTTVPKNKL